MEKYIKALLTKCTCMTKTPLTEYHETGCSYKTALENYHKGENKLNKEQWVKGAYKYLVSITGEWEYPENCLDYCENLYETYVADELFGEKDCTPECAVDEDMTYWE